MYCIGHTSNVNESIRLCLHGRSSFDVYFWFFSFHYEQKNSFSKLPNNIYKSSRKFLAHVPNICELFKDIIDDIGMLVRK